MAALHDLLLSRLRQQRRRHFRLYQRGDRHHAGAAGGGRRRRAAGPILRRHQLGQLQRPAHVPGFTRVDPQIDFDDTGSETDWTSPTASGQTDFEVQWTGEVQAQYSEPYTFYTTASPASELFVNGQEVISDFIHHAATHEHEFADHAGRPARAMPSNSFISSPPVGGAAMYLSWSSPHTPREIVPQSQLFSGSAPAAPSNLQVAAISGTQTEPHLDHQFQRRGRVRGRPHAGQLGHIFARGLPASRFHQYLDTGLTPGQTYTYEVRADEFRGRLGLVQPGGRHDARAARSPFPVRRDDRDDATRSP